MILRKIILTVFLFCSTIFLSAKDFLWYHGGRVGYRIQEDYSPVVGKALELFSADMQAVTGHSAHEKNDGKVIIFQLDRLNDKEFASLEKLRVPYLKFITKADAFWIGIRHDKLVVAGSNGRGTAYGILELSRMAGVSPWIWWGDVVPQRKSRIAVASDFETLQFPSVTYRGVFINDEDWSARDWAHQKTDIGQKKGVMGPKFYHRLFELLLRLRANMLWPAMHEGTTPFFMVKGNKEVADSFDICIGSSHCEPMLRNNVGEWNKKQRGAYNYMTNRRHVQDYWAERLAETASMDAIYTLGMRGIHDGHMQGVHTMPEKVRGLQVVLDDQRKLLKKHVNTDLTKIPQVFIPYKEVLEIYENGLNVPDDVTLMWCDDNYGYLTRLSNSVEQLRQGGGGVYYHLSYWGQPHDYLWLSTTQPGLLYNEMRTAYDHNSRRLWIANVHDPKVAAYQLSLFMDMAWNINAVSSETVRQHLKNWYAQQFGEAVAKHLIGPMTEFYRLCGIRKPEFMGWNRVELDKNKYPQGISPVQDTEFSAIDFGNELERYLADYERVKQQVSRAEELVRPELKDAFFAAVKYPVRCAAAMATKQLQAQEARNLARVGNFHNDPDALTAAVRSLKAYEEIIELTDYYNNRMSGGKWKGSMSMAPRDLPVFGKPSLPGQPTEKERKQYDKPVGFSTKINPDGCVVTNACNYVKATGVRPIEMLGHSMKAVALEPGGKLTYRFYASDGDAVLYTALIPTQPNDGGDLRYAVSLDGKPAFVYSLKEPFRSERWKTNVLRGQAVRSEKVHLTAGTHTLEIMAIDNHIIVDQWMIDYDRERQFYLFPIGSAL